MELQSNEIRLWATILGAPTVFLIELQVSYSLMELVCTTGHIWPLYASTLIALALIAAGGWTSWGELRAPARHDRLRFLAASATALAITSALGVLAMLVPKLFLIPC